MAESRYADHASAHVPPVSARRREALLAWMRQRRDTGMEADKPSNLSLILRKNAQAGVEGFADFRHYWTELCSTDLKALERYGLTRAHGRPARWTAT